MQRSGETLDQIRIRLAYRVRAALDDVTPEFGQSIVGQTTQAAVLVELAATLLSRQIGHASACDLIGEVAKRATIHHGVP